MFRVFILIVLTFKSFYFMDTEKRNTIIKEVVRFIVTIIGSIFGINLLG